MSAAEEPSPSSAPAAAAAAQSTTQLPIHTYHCICTQLLFASTTPLSLLPRRGGNDSSTASDDSQQHDRAYILPLPPPPRSKDADEEDEDGDTAMANKGASDEAQAGGGGQHYALLLGAFVDRGARPRVVQRDDGFEKRYLHRCQRCRIVVGYQLDWAQYPSKAEAEAAEEGGDAEAAGVVGKSGRRTDVVYLLPGGLLNTEEMVAGKDVAKTVGFA